MRSFKSAFTLIELLVVIAIIAILAAILFPVFSQAKAAAKKISCLTQAKETGLSEMMYANDNDNVMVPVSYAQYGSNISSPGFGAGVGLFYWNMTIQPYIKSWDLLICPTGDFQIDPYAAFTNNIGPDTGDKNSNPQYQLRVAWVWNAITQWPEAPLLDQQFQVNSMTGYTEYNDDPYYWWYGDPVSESQVEVPATAIWLAEGNWTDIGQDFNNDYGWQLTHESNPNVMGPTGQIYPGGYVRGRHNDGFNTIYGDGHAKYVKWASTKPCMWAIQECQ